MCVPPEVVSRIADTVDAAPAAAFVPESSALTHCAVVVGAQVVVSVVRGEHHSVVIVKCITGVARVTVHLQLVVA